MAVAPDATDELRHLAEGRVRALEAETPGPLAPEDARLQLHELRVHQIELELQNEELRRVRAELEHTQQRYFDLYNLAPLGYSLLDERGQVLEANLTLATLLALPRAAIVGQPFSRFVLEEDRDIDFVHRRRLFQTEEPQSYELRLVREPGTWFWGQIRASATRSSQGALVCHAALTDIDARKRAEDEAAKLQAELMHAQKLEAVGTLAGGIAHDFNNLLQGIMGGLTCLELELTGHAARAELLELKALVDRGAELTAQLLGFARRGRYDVRPVDLARVVERTSAMFSRTRKQLAVRLDLAAGLPPVLMDHAQLEQVLLNLFVNAAQAMPGGGRLLVRASLVEVTGRASDLAVAEGRYVELIVADNGVGMDAETRSRVFEPFFTTKSPGQGHGMGLASVYGIVKSHGGAISVESTRGVGTTFTLHLPTSDQPVQDERPALAAPTTASHQTVLIVDDEPAVLKVCQRMLERLGYEVLAASSGPQAIELTRQHGERIALAILDMVMPDLSGPKTFEALRALSPRLKVLLASGYSLEGAAQALLDRGEVGFIQKPFSLEGLSVAVQELLDREGTSTPAGAAPSRTIERR